MSEQLKLIPDFTPDPIVKCARCGIELLTVAELGCQCPQAAPRDCVPNHYVHPPSLFFVLYGRDQRKREMGSIA